MKEIIYIVDYSNTLEKQINLLNLIKSINREIYDVCISSHCILPEWIIELCDYYFYDKNNDLLYEPFYKNLDITQMKYLKFGINLFKLNLHGFWQF